MNITDLKQGGEIFFVGEKLPYNIMAISERFAVVSRKACKKEDNNLLKHEVKMGSFLNIDEAFEYYKNHPIYSLVNFEKKIKGSSIYFMKDVDYFSKKDCEQVLNELEIGEEEISRRNSVVFEIDFDKMK